MASRIPYLFDEFFAAGRDEAISPFLRPASRSWGKNLPLKAAIFSAFLLALSWTLSYVNTSASFLCLVPVYFFAGAPALIAAIEDLRNFEINIDVLMTLAALLSVLIGSSMEGALLLVLFELSAAMEEAVSKKTKSALLGLRQLSPRTGNVLEDDGTLIERSVREIEVGMKLLVKAGDVIPLDGLVLAGASFLNLVHLTGESQPVPKKTGDEVPAGGRNLEGSLTLQVTRANADSTLTRIIQLITQAQEAKPNIQRFLDRFGKWYATTIIILTFCFALALPWIFSIPYLGVEGGIYRALTFLIAASPCALIIATPTAYLSAISSCARKGILLKGGVVLDALARCKTVAFDKTGTLTTGKLICEEVRSLQSRPTLSPEEALGIAAALERHAVHPLAEAITRSAEERSIPLVPVESFASLPGLGLKGTIKFQGIAIDVYIGHESLIESKLPQELKEVWEREKQFENFHSHVRTYLLAGMDLFVFYFSDLLRPGVAQMIQELINSDMTPVMLTGDRKEIAENVAKSIGIREVFADLRPEDKLKKVAELSEKEGLIMVGDGVNDAPALARASVGISLGKIGSATAVDASDIVFLHDDITLLPWIKRKSHMTMRIVRENLILAMCVIVLATTPALLGLVPLWVAVVLHEGGTVLVGLNSLRLLRK